MKPITYVSLFTLLFFACNQSEQPSYSLRDSVLNEYLAYHDSIFHWNIKDLDYNLLKAYKKNDTIALKNLQAAIKYDIHFRTACDIISNRLHETSIEDMLANEVYRFNYSANYCSYGTVITITRRGDTINLHAVLLDGLSQDADTFKIKEEYNKRLTQKSMDNLYKALNYANFWELKYDDDFHGDEGDYLTIDAFVKTRFHS